MKTLLFLLLPFTLPAQGLTIPETINYINQKFRTSVYHYHYTEISKLNTQHIDRNEHDSIAITEVGELELFVFSSLWDEDTSRYIPKNDLVKYTIMPNNVSITLDSNLTGWNVLPKDSLNETKYYYFYPPTYSIKIECKENKECIVSIKNISTNHHDIFLPMNSITSNSLFKAFKHLFKKVEADPKYKDPLR